MAKKPSDKKNPQNQETMPQNLDLFKRLAEDAKKTWDADEGIRGTLLNHCQECAEYFLPSRSTITQKKEEGSKRMQVVFRSTGQDALRTWATGMMNGIFPTNSVFHMNRLRGVQVEDTPREGRKWLEDVAAAQYEAIINSNFNEAFHNGFLDEGAFGTSAIFVGESERENEVVYFKNFSIENYTLRENYRGEVVGIVVRDSYTKDQLVEKFGKDAVPPEILNDTNNDNKNNPHIVLFAVMPNELYEPQKTKGRGKDVATNRPYKYVYCMYEGLKVLETGGYYEFPFVITRINKAYNEKFGRSPAMDALPECKMHNKVAEYDIAATERLIRPSYIVNSDAIMGPINPQPGSIVSADFSKGGNPVAPFPTADNPSWGENLEEKTKQAINRIFMTDVFMTISIDNLGQQGITATQWTMAKSERMAQLGALLRINEREKIRPLMDRIFGILWRIGKIPNPPKEIAGLEFDSQPTSPLFSTVENAYEVEALDRQVGYCAQVSEIKPDIWDNLDLDAGFNLISAAGGTAARTTVDAETVKKIREQRAEAQRQREMAQIALQQQQMQAQQG